MLLEPSEFQVTAYTVCCAFFFQLLLFTRVETIYIIAVIPNLSIMKVQIILGSKSDMPVAEKAKEILEEFEVDHDIRVASAHRTPDVLKEVVEGSDADVFIGVAGLAAALPGGIAAHTVKPVIGVPVSGKVNLDAILSIIQMPPGIPVGAVGLDRGENAALLAVEILAVGNEKLMRKLENYREEMKKKVLSESEV
jgi:5-(carboxyamino)imidazole ribonucleotide mutase